MSVTSAGFREQAVTRILEMTRRSGRGETAPWLVLTVGLPGSGKSTFSRKLARATGAAVLESDGLRVALFEQPSHDKEESKQLFDAIYSATEQLLRDRVSVIVDATNLRERDREHAYAAAAQTGAKLLVLRFQAPREVIAERMGFRDGRRDPEDSSTAGMAVYERMAETEEPVRREHWEIDTSDAEATQAALKRAIETLKPPPHAGEGQNTGGIIS